MPLRPQAPRDPVLVKRVITLHGSVQGLGIRPAVACLARSLRLGGSVRNDQRGVWIEVVGDEQAISTFISELPHAVSAEFSSDAEAPVDPTHMPDTFAIAPSRVEGPTRTNVPLDRMVCAACLREMETPSDRRYGYPFISCTHCGPRYSILQSMPYDRHRTSMAQFEMCARCRQEYEDADDRRFHSQTNCCPDCGPNWWSVRRDSKAIHFRSEALQQAEEVLRQGGIVSLKGIGGYQLICDAANEQSIGRLREAKHRPRKPVAVMVGSIAEATAIALLSPLEQASLQSAAGPIVIARARLDSSYADHFARGIFPGLRDIGLMLPTTPLHHWLCRRANTPLVVTSGNREGEPLVYQPSQAEERLGTIADLQLHHDREIVRPIDDAVVRCIANRIVTLRAGRGLAPMSFGSTSPTPALALGGHQKVAVAISNGHLSILGPHVGEMDHAESRTRYIQQLQSLCQLYDCDPKTIAHDLHPEFFTTQFARSPQRFQPVWYAIRSSPRTNQEPVELSSVQHHHAHVLSGMAEHGWLDRTVLGISMDGTGLGTDETIWGGEVLRVSATGFDRCGHLRPFRLAGAEAAIRDPTRVAIALIADAMGTDALATGNPFGLDFAQTTGVLQVLSKSTWSPSTTSAGRLFDGVAAIALGDVSCSYEGELAMRLEAICDERDHDEYSFPITADRPLQIDWRSMIRQLLADRRDGIAAGVMAMRFHRGLARAIVSVMERFAELPVVLAGGVFQNRRLVELVVNQMPVHREFAIPTKIPPNDGGLAAGQLAAVQFAEPFRRR